MIRLFVCLRKETGASTERILTEYLVSHASLETYAFKTLRGTQISVHFYLLSHGVIISESKPIPFFRMRRPPLYLFEKQ